MHGKLIRADNTVFFSQIVKEATTQVLIRGNKLCNFVEWREYKLVYKRCVIVVSRSPLPPHSVGCGPRVYGPAAWTPRYASLYFCVGVDPTDNELITLEVIQHFVEILDRYFGNVCELDLIFNFHKAYYILDEASRSRPVERRLFSVKPVPALVSSRCNADTKKAPLRTISARLRRF